MRFRMYRTALFTVLLACTCGETITGIDGRYGLLTRYKGE